MIYLFAILIFLVIALVLILYFVIKEMNNAKKQQQIAEENYKILKNEKKDSDKWAMKTVDEHNKISKKVDNIMNKEESDAKKANHLNNLFNGTDTMYHNDEDNL